MQVSVDGVLWDEAGLRIEAQPHDGGIVCDFEDLNPQVKFRYVFTRWEMFRVGLWFVRKALKRHTDREAPDA